MIRAVWPYSLRYRHSSERFPYRFIVRSQTIAALRPATASSFPERALIYNFLVSLTESRSCHLSVRKAAYSNRQPVATAASHSACAACPRLPRLLPRSSAADDSEPSRSEGWTMEASPPPVPSWVVDNNTLYEYESYGYIVNEKLAWMVGCALLVVAEFLRDYPDDTVGMDRPTPPCRRGWRCMPPSSSRTRR